jgi:hypothetical protein
MMANELNLTFRKLILFSVLTVLLGVGVVFALSYEFTPQNSSQPLPTTQGVYDGFQLTMTLEKTEYTLGEPIEITLTLTNIGNQTASFGLDWANDFGLQVSNGTNSTIYSSINDSGPFHQYVVMYETLNAGESLSENLSWQQISYPAAWQPEGVPVLPGTYYIVGQIGPIYGANSTIETTPMQVTIVNP